MWRSPYPWHTDADGKPTLDDKPGNHPLILDMPLEDAVKLGIAEKDGTPISPTAVKKAIKAAAKAEQE